MNARLYARPSMHVVKHRHTTSFRRPHRRNENGGSSPRDEDRFRFAQLAKRDLDCISPVNSEDRTDSFGSYNVERIAHGTACSEESDSGMLARAGSVHMVS